MPANGRWNLIHRLKVNGFFTLISCQACVSFWIHMINLLWRWHVYSMYTKTKIYFHHILCLLFLSFMGSFLCEVCDLLLWIGCRWFIAEMWWRLMMFGHRDQETRAERMMPLWSSSSAPCSMCIKWSKPGFSESRKEQTLTQLVGYLPLLCKTFTNSHYN